MMLFRSRCRQVWRSLLLCMLVLAASAAGRAQIHHGPYLTLAGQTSMTVVWTTASPAPGAVVYGRTPALGSLAVDSAAGIMHQVQLSGLQPDTRYFYRVISGTDTAREASFVTAPRPGLPFTFAVYGDTRTRRKEHIEVLQRMSAGAPRFILNTGDLVASNTEKNWDDFFTDLCTSTDVGLSIPYYASPGNHEEGTMYYQGLVLPHNNPADTEEYYSFTYGDVYVVAVNTEVPYGPGSPQYAWLQDDLASPAAREASFRVAFWHRPPYSTNNHGSDMEVRATLCPLVEAAGVDVVFNGHDHCYERTVPINGTTYIVAGGGGAPLYDFKADSVWVAYKEKTTHYCALQVSGDMMTVTMIRAGDGAAGDQFRVVRGAPRNPAGGAMVRPRH